MVPGGPLEAYLRAREALIATARGGTADARALADMTDEAVSALAEAASSRVHVRFAVLALGAYGARRLLPHSDIDLLIVSPGTAVELEPLARSLLYPLWDAGLAVGHQVRTPKQVAHAIEHDVTVLTSLLTARSITGDEALAREALTRAFTRIRKKSQRHLRSIEARPRPGSPYLLEPDLKEGAGGQRDLDELVWRAAVTSVAPAHDFHGLVAAGRLAPDEAERLDAAQDTLTAARWRLDRQSGRRRSVMTIDDAEAAGVDADATQRALETVHHLLLSVRERFAGSPGPETAPLGARELESLAARGDDALPALERAAWAGRLEDVLPGMRDLMTLRRPGLSHRFTVGAHCLRTLVQAGSVDAVRDLEPSQRAALLVAALTHDLGKRDPGPQHAEKGAPHAAEVARRLGYGAEVAAAASTLVREHLLLAEAATRIDPDDDDAVLAVAARLGDSRLVGPLHLLTAADMQATAPDVWTPWRAALVNDLVQRIGSAFDSGAATTESLSAAERTRAEALAEAGRVGAPRSVLAFVEEAPIRYLTKRTPADVISDARLASRLSGPTPDAAFALGVRPGPAPETWAVDVLMRRRPDRVAVVAGVLTLSGCDVLAAEASFGPGSVTVDRFIVTSATHAPIEHDTWAAVERTLAAALSGRLDIETRLAERAKHYDTPGRRSSAHVSIPATSPFGFTVRVVAADRVGLLHDVARALAAQGLEIRRATVLTASGVADDTFEVTYAGIPGAETSPDSIVPLIEAAALGAPLGDGHRSQS